MRNSPIERERRQKVAAENAADRAKRSDRQQIEHLLVAGHTATKEIARLKARIKKEKKDEG